MPWTSLYSTSIPKGSQVFSSLTYASNLQFIVRNNGLLANDTVNWGVIKIKRLDPAFAGGAYYYVSKPLYQGLEYASFALPNYGTLTVGVYVNKGYFDLAALVDLFQFV